MNSKTSVKKSVIGIILDWDAGVGFSSSPYFALRTHYIDAVRLAGGTPWLIPYGDVESVEEYLGAIDGLLVPGGFYAMPNHWYENSDKTSPYEKTPRFEFEEILIKRALEIDMPMLCICAGLQVVGGLFGCKLTSELKGDVEHFDLTKDHEVNIVPGTILHKIAGRDVITANSHHQEAIISVQGDVNVSARSLDGCIEAIELSNKKFVLGFQWHPEMMCAKKEQIENYNPHHLIFKEFVNAASN